MLPPDDARLRGAPAAGDILEGKYTIERVLGAGGMGLVLAARHNTLGQQVAVKVLLPDFAKDPEAVERFLREARASTNLKSEHVARVLDVGKNQNGTPFMIMEFLKGQDLQQALRTGGPLAIPAAADYVLQAAEALAEAHSMGIVHRDLKPANLFVTERADGSPLVKVLDFGISKAVVAGEQGITRTDAVMGSPGYMSPEQIRSSKHVDQRSDVWGLGVVLYELLTGVAPFEGEHLAAISVKIVLEPPKPIEELRQNLPRALTEVVVKCLEKEPARRFQNMAELAESLLPFASKESASLVERIRRVARASVPFAETIRASDSAVTGSIQGATASAWERSSAPNRRRRVAFGIAASVVTGVVTLLATFALGQRTAREGTPESSKSAESTHITTAPTPAPVTRPPTREDTAPPTETGPPNLVSKPSPVASASQTPTPRKKRPTSSQAITRSKPPSPCPAGQTSTKGHCCPAGMVWQGGACDRPLATSLP